MTVPNVLSIAGSDPSGGAGIAADLKTFGALGAYGMAVVTAVTVQNTQSVHAIHPIPAQVVEAQLGAVLDDVRVDAVKIGLLPDPATVGAVARLLAGRDIGQIILDPVFRSSTGASLSPPAAFDALKASLLPLVDVLTPNLAEAALLLGEGVACTVDEMAGQAARLRSLGPEWVLLKGGHLGGQGSPDVLAGQDGTILLPGSRLDVPDCHGTGCTLSAALAALTVDRSILSAASRAKQYVHNAIDASVLLDVGRGAGPLHHFYGGHASVI